MKYQKAKAREMKYRALLWLRLDQRCAFIATESGGYNSDVIGVNEKKLIEIEIKVSHEDLKKDFAKQKHHHYYHANPESHDFTKANRWVPTHFYFAVPTDLVESAKLLIEKKGFEPYGVIDADTWTVVKRAGWLHKRPPESAVKFIIALRMGSELLRFHEAML